MDYIAMFIFGCIAGWLARDISKHRASSKDARGVDSSDRSRGGA